MITADYHLHSSFSSDSSAPLEMQVQHAIAHTPLQTLCITDHIDFDFPKNPDGFTFVFDMELYIEEIKRLKEIYSDKLSLQTGIELGLLPHLKEKLTDFLIRYEGVFDFIICSSSLVQYRDL